MIARTALATAALMLLATHLWVRPINGWAIAVTWFAFLTVELLTWSAGVARKQKAVGLVGQAAKELARRKAGRGK